MSATIERREVLETLRRDILCELGAAAPLEATHLARRIPASVSSVRAGLRALVAAGLVEYVRGSAATRGWYLVPSK